MVEIDIAPNLFSGSFVVSWHGFFTFIAVVTAVVLVARWAPLRGIDPDDILSIAIWAIVGGVVGARVVHVIDNWTDLYQDNPVQVLYIWNGGIGIWGAILGGFLAGAAYSLLKKHPVGVIADLTAPVMLLSQTIGRLGDIVNGEHCAKATDLFFGFVWTHAETAARSCASGFGTIEAQPVIAYQMIWNLLALAVIWRLRGRLKPDGMLFVLYLALYSVGRFAISFAREDRIWALGMQEAHYVALLVLAVTVPILVIKARFRERTEEAPAVVERGTRAERRRRARARGA